MANNFLQLTVNNFIGFLVQLLLFLFIPYVWWRCQYRYHRERLLPWLGFKRPKLHGSLLVLLFFAVLYYLMYRFDPTLFIDLAAGEKSEHLVAGMYIGMGYKAILPAFVSSFLQTSLTEELLFRGFIGKRLAGKLGFASGNILQAIIFGCLHNALLLLTGVNICLGVHLQVFILSATAGALMFYLNERTFNGSIIPSIVVHGTANFIASMLTAF